MSAGPNTANVTNQAEAETSRHPVQDYADAARYVAATIADRGETHGDPEAFGQTFADMLNAYLRPLVAGGRPLTPADAFVVLDLMKVARVAVGGPQVDHFRDMAGYGLLGLVHVTRVMERAGLEAKRRAEAEGAAKPKETAPTAGEELEEPEDDDTALRRDEERADTADLVRWIMDEGSDPFADLIQPNVPGESGRKYRPGITVDDVQARFDRVHAILDGKAPEGVTANQWLIIRNSRLPETYASKV